MSHSVDPADSVVGPCVRCEFKIRLPFRSVEPTIIRNSGFIISGTNVIPEGDGRVDRISQQNDGSVAVPFKFF